jgi:hypothetical protein
VTTVLADARLGVMVSDSNETDGDRTWSTKKVHRVNGALIGLAGVLHIDGDHFLDWYRAGMVAPPEFDFEESTALILDHDGLWLFDSNCITIVRVTSGREAIGTGGKGAICAYEALGWTDPAKAVRIACRHDGGSRPPVRTYKLGKPA